MKLLILNIADATGSPWRRVRVPADIGLDDLHVVIQAIMGWDDSLPHRWRLGGGRAASAVARIDDVFTAPDVAIGYVYDARFEVTVTAVTLERTEKRSNDDFAVLAADGDVAALCQRLREAFFTVTYNPDHTPDFKAWSDRERVSLFEEAVMRALAHRQSHQPGVQLRERARLQCMLEELLASSSMTILRDALARLTSQGLGRGEAMDALVALAASFPGEVTDVEEQLSYLSAVKELTAESCRQTFPNGPIPVIAARFELAAARKRNQRRRKR